MFGKCTLLSGQHTITTCVNCLSSRASCLLQSQSDKVKESEEYSQAKKVESDAEQILG